MTLARGPRLLLSLGLITCVHAWSAEAPIRLTIDSPNAMARFSSLEDPEVTTGVGGIQLDRDWALTFRAQITDAAFYVASHSTTAPDVFAGRRFIVISDPDSCLNLSAFIEGGAPYDSMCAEANEEVLEVYPDLFDAAGIVDAHDWPPLSDVEADDGDGARFDNCALRPTGAPWWDPRPFAEYLVDNFENTTRLDYRRAERGDGPTERSERVGPKTGGTIRDCYGYGSDDDLPGLVVMANIGAARFYTRSFDPDPTRPRQIKNMAGFLSNVAVELSDSLGRTFVTATMIAKPGMFEPLVAFDADVTSVSAQYLRRVDGGPVERMNYSSLLPPPVHRLANETPIRSVYVRAVLVKGTAPSVIVDVNGDGQYTSADLTGMGYTLLSNEARAWVRTASPSRLDDDTDRTLLTCPDPVPFRTDLDGNGYSGADCSTGSSNSKVRVPN
jgi:hypothetical protein